MAKRKSKSKSKAKAKATATSPIGLVDSEASFLAAYDPRAFAPIAVTVDVALVSAFAGKLRTLVHKRDEHPFKHMWSLPGGFVAPNEALHGCAERVLRDKLNLSGVFLEQLYTFGSPKRDPRMRIVTVAYYALVDHQRFAKLLPQVRNCQAAQLLVEWAGETGGPVAIKDQEGQMLDLAFDHADILGTVVKRMRGKLNYSPIGFQLLPQAFTLRALQEVHETVLSRKVNKDSFRRRMLASGQLEATGERQESVGHRPAELYRFIRRSAV